MPAIGGKRCQLEEYGLCSSQESRSYFLSNDFLAMPAA